MAVHKCSLVRCIHARLLGPSSLQCPVTFICGCANINLSSPLILSLSSPLILSSYPHCSLVRCIHARLLGPSSLQCLVTFICGCAIINLSSPEIFFSPPRSPSPRFVHVNMIPCYHSTSSSTVIALLIYFSLPITLLMNYFGQRMTIKTLKSGSMTVENKYEMKYWEIQQQKWRAKSGQTGGGEVDKLGVELDLL